MTKHLVSSEENLLNLGFSENSYEFFEPERALTLDYTLEGFYEAMIIMNSNLHLHHRSIYTIWDFFGDVGGLFDMLALLATPIFWFVTLIIGSGSDRFLIKTLFKVQRKMNDSHKVEDYIKRRKPLRAKRCNWICDR